MKIKMIITQTTANYFLANDVTFAQIGDDGEVNGNGGYLVEVTVENGMDLYAIYDAGRCYGRDIPNGF
jgi:hypothetical protein